MRRLNIAPGARSLAAIALMLAAVGGWLLLNELDYRDAVARQTAAREHRQWAERNCLPQARQERSVIERRGDGSTQCTRYINAGYGRAPVLVYAEVQP